MGLPKRRRSSDAVAVTPGKRWRQDGVERAWSRIVDLRVKNSSKRAFYAHWEGRLSARGYLSDCSLSDRATTARFFLLRVQVDGARVALAHNAGGILGTDAAAMCVTILSR